MSPVSIAIPGGGDMGRALIGVTTAAALAAYETADLRAIVARANTAAAASRALSNPDSWTR